MKYAEVNGTVIHYPNIVSPAHICDENINKSTIYFWEVQRCWFMDDSSMEGATKIYYCPFCGKELPTI